MKKNHVNGVLKLSLMGALVFANISWKNASTNGKNPTLTINGFTFEDLNRNGKLDKYEDYRLPVSERIDDLISKMTDEEKASMLMGTGMPGFDGLTPVVGAVEGRVPGAAGVLTKLNVWASPKLLWPMARPACVLNPSVITIKILITVPLFLWVLHWLRPGTQN